MPRPRWLWGLVASGCFVDAPALGDGADDDESEAAHDDGSDGAPDPGDGSSDEGTPTSGPGESASSDDGTDAESTGAPIDCAPTPPGIVAWWRADGDMSDSIGGATASSMGGLDATAVGYVHEGFHFDGIDDALAIDDAMVLGTAFTIEAWVRLDGLDQPQTDAGVAGDMEIVGKMAAGASPNADGWRLFKQTDADELWFCVGALDNGCRPDGANTVHTASTPVDEWQHVAAVRDGDRIAIHLDGVLVDESTLVDAIDTSTAAVSIGAGTADIGATFTSFFFGTIDEVALYDRALAPDELAALADATAGKCR